MGFEILQSTNFKKFGGEYLMIEISILTALALEDFAQDMNRRSLAKQASVKIDAEIRANISTMSAVIEHNQSEVDKLSVIRKALLADIKSGVSAAILKERVSDKCKGAFNLSIQSPSLRREAWDVAVANQPVSFMPEKEPTRYSVAYASMRDMQTANSGMNNHFLDGPRMLDLTSDVQMGNADPRAVFRMLNQIISSYYSVNDNLRILHKELEAAAKAAPKRG